MERTIIVCKAIEVSTLQVENPRSEVMVNTVNAKKKQENGNGNKQEEKRICNYCGCKHIQGMCPACP